MIKPNDAVVMKAIAICFKPFLKPEEALIYTNLGRTQFAKKCEEFGVYKTENGYFKKEDLDLLCAGETSKIQEKANRVRLPGRQG